MKKLRILALVHDHLVPPEDTTGIDVLEAEWKMEYDVIETLREMGHEVRVLGIHDELGSIRPTAGHFKPHIVFNLMEAFAGVTTFDQNVVSYLELLRLPYTGCNPRGLILARDKALSKKLLAYHRIPVPDFTVVRRGRKPRLSKRLHFPLIVKSLFFEASTGISQASVVENDEQLARRVQFIHDSLGTRRHRRAVHRRPRALRRRGRQRAARRLSRCGRCRSQDAGQPLADRDRAREVEHAVSEEARHHDRRGGPRRRWSLDQIQRIAKRTYRALDLSGYARIDLRHGRGRGASTCSRPTRIRTWPTVKISRNRPRSAACPTSGSSNESSRSGLRWEPERT